MHAGQEAPADPVEQTNGSQETSEPCPKAAPLPLQVYKAELDGVEEVAIKFIVPSEAFSMQNLPAELAISCACRHENVCRFIGAWLQKVRLTRFKDLATSSLHPQLRPTWPVQVQDVKGFGTQAHIVEHPCR